jgi:hypothetical protein
MVAEQDTENAIKRLRSLHDGDLGVVEVIACGKQAIPLLRKLLFEREPSGLYQVRCRAAEGLAGLRAYDVLIEFLNAERMAADPVERLGDEAVINAAALALGRWGSQRAFELLLRLGNRSPLTGVIGALGAFNRVEAIPVLVDALGDDASRQTAEAALNRLGRSAAPALMRVAGRHMRAAESESESSLRQRRSALGVLLQIGISRKTWPGLRHLVQDRDPKIAILACKICLLRAPASERSGAIHRLIGLLDQIDWMLRDDIENCLIAHFDTARNVIAGRIEEDSVNNPLSEQAKQLLLRVQERSEHFSKGHSSCIPA